MPTQTELAWAAGFIDGEGSISITKRYPKKKRGETNFSYKLEINAVNTKVAPIMRLQALFGGKLQVCNVKLKNARIIHRWTIFDKQAEQCLLLILPYLSCKYEQAQLALEFRRVVKQRTHRPLSTDQVNFRELCHHKMRILNTHGTKALGEGKQEKITDYISRVEKQTPLF